MPGITNQAKCRERLYRSVYQKADLFIAARNYGIKPKKCGMTSIVIRMEDMIPVTYRKIFIGKKSIQDSTDCVFAGHTPINAFMIRCFPT
jgi:hypothetical protein